MRRDAGMEEKMTKIDIISGFLGAGKTTLIRKLLKEALAGSQVVLIENEFGEIGIDGGFLKESGIEIREMNSGCICCSLVGDFGTSLKEVMETYHPDRILIEPSGVGTLSDVMKAVENVDMELTLNSAVAVVDASKCRMYMKNFGEFFINQIEHAGTIILSRTDVASPEKVQQAVDLIREHNSRAALITTPISGLDGKEILKTIENGSELEKELMKEVMEHHHEHGEECGCQEHHHEHHHEHGEECGCHEHHHEHGEECGCQGHHHEHGHHHHHADEVFTSWGMETPAVYSRERVEKILEALDDEETYGFVLRAKGMLPEKDGSWIHFDYVPGEGSVREGAPDVTGKFCVIGSGLREDALKELFTA